MSETCQFEVDAIDGDVLRATLTVIHPDENYLWVSPGALACLLQQLADRKDATATAKLLRKAGFYFEQEASNAAEVADLNESASAFFASVEVGATQNMTVVATRPREAIRFDHVPDAEGDPCVELVLRVRDPDLLRALSAGDRVQTIQNAFGELLP